MKPTDFAKHVSEYFSVYLPGQRGLSANTIRSYRDTFCLLLEFCQTEKNIKIEKFSLSQFSKELVEDYLTWLENERKCSASTRNQRLSAIHAFCRYLISESPEMLLSCQRVLSIKLKRCAKPQIRFLSAEEISEILSKPDSSDRYGRRDLTILCLLYDTGARVSELINIRVKDVRFDDFPVVKLTGKGQKTRAVPLMSKTAEHLKNYILENKLVLPEKADNYLFTNHQNHQLTRAGITYILQKYSAKDKITPHILRHTKAMHLLQAGINIVYIRDILGHVDISTTETYVRADTEMKREALEKVYKDLTPNAVSLWNNDSNLMDWLHSLS